MGQDLDALEIEGRVDLIPVSFFTRVVSSRRRRRFRFLRSSIVVRSPFAAERINEYAGQQWLEYDVSNASCLSRN